jgi:hypothetical protein
MTSAPIGSNPGGITVQCTKPAQLATIRCHCHRPPCLPWRNSRRWRLRNDSDDLALIEVGLLERHDYLNLNRGTAG